MKIQSKLISLRNCFNKLIDNGSSKLFDLEINSNPNDLTIVIPSKGRPLLLKALLKYYDQHKIPYKIIVLLSGDKGLHKCNEFPSLNIDILELDENYDLSAKLALCESLVTTPLIALCTDDDLALADSLINSANFLMSNLDYSACQGYHVLFSQKSSTVNLLKILWFCPSVESEDPLLRVHKMMNRYQPVCWAVFRKTTFDKIISFSSPGLPLVFQELIWTLIATIDGKIKRLHEVSCFRRLDRTHITGHPLFAMMESPNDFFIDYVKYRNILSNQLIKLIDRKPTDIARALDLSHLSYFGKEIDMSKINFFADLVLDNPDSSIHDFHISKHLISDVIHLESGWLEEIYLNNINFKLFEQYLSPTPKNEIFFSTKNARNLIKNISLYFSNNL